MTCIVHLHNVMEFLDLNKPNRRLMFSKKPGGGDKEEHSVATKTVRNGSSVAMSSLAAGNRHSAVIATPE